MFADPYGAVIRPSISCGRRAKAQGGSHRHGVRRLRANDPSLRQALDRIASCAAVSLGAPLGAVSLVEAGEVALLGMHGFERREMVREGSFCSEVVRLGTKLLIADATADPRFRTHEFVTVGGVRAYAGAPIKAAGGGIWGAVCVFAGEPDAFQPSGLDDLEALAHMVELLLAQPGPEQVELPVVRRQGWIGVRTLDARRAGTGARAGLTVLSVAKGSPAERAGLRPTDVLYAADDFTLRERADLVAALANREPGSSARITLQRAGKWLERHVAIATRQVGAAA